MIPGDLYSNALQELRNIDKGYLYDSFEIYRPFVKFKVEYLRSQQQYLENYAPAIQMLEYQLEDLYQLALEADWIERDLIGIAKNNCQSLAHTLRTSNPEQLRLLPPRFFHWQDELMYHLDLLS